MTLVYSTGVGRIKEEPEIELPPQGDGIVRLKKDTKGRKGSGVVLIEGTGLDKDGLKELCSFLKKKMGSGGSVEGWNIIIQGSEKREQVKTLLEAKGYKVKLAGG